MSEYTSILEKNVGTAQAPKPLPRGTYFGTIAELPAVREVTTKEGKKGVLSIIYALTEADADVDEDELEEAGGLLRNDGKPKTVRQEFWLDEGSMYKVDQFLAGFGFNAESEQTYEDALQTLPGQAVTVALDLRTYKTKNDEERSVNDVLRAHATE